MRNIKSKNCQAGFLDKSLKWYLINILIHKRKLSYLKGKTNNFMMLLMCSCNYHASVYMCLRSCDIKRSKATNLQNNKNKTKVANPNINLLVQKVRQLKQEKPVILTGNFLSSTNSRHCGNYWKFIHKAD